MRFVSSCLVPFALLIITKTQRFPSPSLHAPILKASSPEGFLPESAPIGTPVLMSPIWPSNELMQIIVLDRDLQPGMQPAIYQYLVTGEGARIFAVDQGGFIYLNSNSIDADPPHPSVYRLNIQAREVNTMPVRSSAPVSLIIHIVDVNDNAPTFESSLYSAKVEANGGRRRVLMLEASDKDSDVYSQLEYRIVSVTDDIDRAFEYDPKSHILWALEPLELGRRYLLLLEAVDGGGKTGTTAIVITVTNEENKRQQKQKQPLLLQRMNKTVTVHVDEDIRPGSVVVELQEDQNDRNLIQYTIISGNEEGLFGIDADSGSVSTVLPLDREVTPLFTLHVHQYLRNSSPSILSTIITIIVQDVNDNAPQFVDPQPLLFEIGPYHERVVGRVLAVDRDEGVNGHVVMKIQPPNDRWFSLSDDDLLLINDRPPPPSNDFYHLSVIAEDGGNPPLKSPGLILVHVLAFSTTAVATSLSPMSTRSWQSPIIRQTTPHQRYVSVPASTKPWKTSSLTMLTLSVMTILGAIVGLIMAVGCWLHYRTSQRCPLRPPCSITSKMLSMTSLGKDNIGRPILDRRFSSNSRANSSVLFNNTNFY